MLNAECGMRNAEWKKTDNEDRDKDEDEDEDNDEDKDNDKNRRAPAVCAADGSGPRVQSAARVTA